MLRIGKSLHRDENADQSTRSAFADVDSWKRAKAVFLEAIERPDAERRSLVAALCAGDEELRAEVESLLVNEDAASGFCETPAHALLAEAPVAAERLPVGTRIGPYEIIGFIAAGGMGEVYRARHAMLGRIVALKTVSGTLDDPSARRRLIREAQHASTLAHPNICTIYEAGEVDDRPFIAMQYVEGRPLRDILHDGVPDLRVALDLGIQVADALIHAHGHGIVHRDLKSANVVVDAGGRATVLDFGLAKRVARLEESEESTLTMAGGVAGTLSHMAPEVLLGGSADVRSDIWSLGVLLYELTSGTLPFTGRTPYETSSAIISEPPRPMGTRVPLAVRLVVERCLVKDADARYQCVSDIRSALDAIRRRHGWRLVGRLLLASRRRTVEVVAASVLAAPLLFVAGNRLRERVFRPVIPKVSTLAILPLTNATGDPRLGYYADGFAEALSAQLGALADVRIVSPRSAAHAASAATGRATIAAQLGANVLAEGTLRRASGRIELGVQLIDPVRDRVLWSESYERDASEVLVLQADVVRGLAQAVRLVMRPAAQDRLATVRAVRPAVYEAYLAGRYEWNQRTPASLQRAVAAFSRAVALDPTYAPAHAALADCYNQMATVMVGTGSPRTFRPRAAAEAIKALQLDPYSAEAHAALGYVRHYQWQWAEAESELRKAIDLNPSYSLARIWYANMLMSRGRMDEAVQQVFVARDLDPFSLVVNTNVGWVLNFAGRHKEAIAQLEHTLALDSNYVQANARLAGALGADGQYRASLERANRVVALTHRAAPSLGGLVGAQAAAGDRDEARATLRELIARSRVEYVPAWAIGSAYAALGDVDNGVAWATKAFAEGSNVVAYFAVDPETTALRRDPRFRRLMARAGLE
jgi:TolB-like protein/Tfp pilus assembly protein PilF